MWWILWRPSVSKRLSRPITIIVETEQEIVEVNLQTILAQDRRNLCPMTDVMLPRRV